MHVSRLRQVKTSLKIFPFQSLIFRFCYAIIILLNFTAICLGVAQLGSAPPWGGGGRGFKSRHSDQPKASTRISRSRLFFLLLKRRYPHLNWCRFSFPKITKAPWSCSDFYCSFVNFFRLLHRHVQFLPLERLYIEGLVPYFIQEGFI